MRDSADINDLEKIIDSFGGQVDRSLPPVLLEESEIMIRATGPSKMTDKLLRIPGVIKVYPDSDMELF